MIWASIEFSSTFLGVNSAAKEADCFTWHSIRIVKASSPLNVSKQPYKMTMRKAPKETHLMPSLPLPALSYIAAYAARLDCKQNSQATAQTAWHLHSGPRSSATTSCTCLKECACHGRRRLQMVRGSWRSRTAWTLQPADKEAMHWLVTLRCNPL